MQTSDFGVDMVHKTLDGTTHILTAFYSGRAGPLTKNTAQLTCLRTKPAFNLTDNKNGKSLGTGTRLSIATLLVAMFFSSM